MEAYGAVDGVISQEIIETIAGENKAFYYLIH